MGKTVLFFLIASSIILIIRKIISLGSKGNITLLLFYGFLLNNSLLQESTKDVSIGTRMIGLKGFHPI